MKLKHECDWLNVCSCSYGNVAARIEWKFVVEMGSGGQCVMMAGAWLIPGVVCRKLNFTNSAITLENIVVALLTALIIL